ncbi:hypothetical protein [Shewanella sp. 10N.286.48.B5]|uniref:hypothetical protein n=1 Tax=Shewanella sp. 10N.286.48.B5 TaxID=1880834 RepID=UPI000C85CADE|nr:hypothetical protein [Shewanella sp. 10N.286.48.B5]PMH86433.1 hypothetical protein BCU57_01895 [Shewanella sp. 10N.286.48.B5]
MSFLKHTLIPDQLTTARIMKKISDSNKRQGQKTITFQETEEFYSDLDELVKNKKKVIIKFSGDKMDKDSPLWERLSKCNGWDAVANTIQNDSKVASKIVQPNLVSSLTGGELLLLAYFATLIFGLCAYAVYKGRKVRVKGKEGESEGEIIIE